MKESTSTPSQPPKPTLAEHEGIVEVQVVPDGSRLEIAYDPAKLSESDLRILAKEYATEVSTALQKRTFQLKDSGCEACAIKLERKVRKIPGVRKATATYLGQVLCLTFDSEVAAEANVMASVRQTGAHIQPLKLASPKTTELSLGQKLRAGELNEEVSCAVGTLFLIAAFVVERSSGVSGLTHGLYAGAYIFCGQKGVRSALASLRQRVLDVDVLMVLAALGAALVGAPFEGALLLFLFSFSNVLQRYAMERTQRAIQSLLTLRPDQALLKEGNQTRLVAVEDLNLDDIVVVRPGEYIPVDGLITEGSSSIDESSLTGESMPVSKTVGQSLFAGTLNQSGGLEVRVNKKAEDSTLAKMVKLVAEAQAEKSKTQRFLEEAEQHYAVGVIVFTALVFLIPWALMGQSFAEAFYRAMTIMVVASPCALVISTPATVLSAIGGAARRGILIKGGSHLEQAARIDIVAIDKTGTLTVGKPSLNQIVTSSGVHPLSSPLPPEVTALLQVAASLESKSEHPLAQSILRSATQLQLNPAPAQDFQSSAGRGAEATVGSERYLIGSERWLRELNATGMEALMNLSGKLQAEGKTCVWLGQRQGEKVQAQAVLILADTLRPEARELVRDLHQQGVKKVVMLTGDHGAVARAIATEAGVDEVLAELLPADKLEVIRKLKTQGSVMMIGDGVNDAPALAAADLSMAMGGAGTDIAMETADIVLMGDRLDNIARMLSLARKTRRVLRQNLIFSGGVIVVLIAAALGFALPLPIGVIGHEGSTVLVCLNGLRLLFFR